MVLTFPLAYPISKILDCILGDEVVSYDRKRLMELIKVSIHFLQVSVGLFESVKKCVLNN